MKSGTELGERTDPGLHPGYLLVYSTMTRQHRAQPRASGGRRSEVKEEGWAQPASGDMSAVGHPMALAAAPNE